jgi:hypothetical protein
VRMARSYVLTHARLPRGRERSALTQRSSAAWRQGRADSSPIAAKPVITNAIYAPPPSTALRADISTSSRRRLNASRFRELKAQIR